MYLPCMNVIETSIPVGGVEVTCAIRSSCPCHLFTLIFTSRAVIISFLPSCGGKSNIAIIPKVVSYRKNSTCALGAASSMSLYEIPSTFPIEIRRDRQHPC